MTTIKFNCPEERIAFMERRLIRYLLASGKPIPSKPKPVVSPYPREETTYHRGIFASIQHHIGNIFTRYPKAVAAGILALAAYIFFRRANAITQWAGGLALTTLLIANPELAAKMAIDTHQYMTYSLQKAGKILTDKAAT